VLTNNFSSSTVAWAAIATGVVGLLGLTFIMLFFAVGKPFGAFNDICNGLGAVLSAVLAWGLYPRLHAQSPLLSQTTLAIAVLGAILAVAGSYLVLSDGWGLVFARSLHGTGYSMIGLWLLGVTYLALQDHSLPQGGE
jgi:hypothetical protein